MCILTGPKPAPAPAPPPPPTPTPDLLGDGQAKRAALKIGGRKKQIDDAIDAATK